MSEILLFFDKTFVPNSLSCEHLKKSLLKRLYVLVKFEDDIFERVMYLIYTFLCRSSICNEKFVIARAGNIYIYIYIIHYYKYWEYGFLSILQFILSPLKQIISPQWLCIALSLKAPNSNFVNATFSRGMSFNVHLRRALETKTYFFLFTMMQGRQICRDICKSDMS